MASQQSYAITVRLPPFHHFLGCWLHYHHGSTPPTVEGHSMELRALGAAVDFIAEHRGAVVVEVGDPRQQGFYKLKKS